MGHFTLGNNLQKFFDYISVSAAYLLFLYQLDTNMIVKIFYGIFSLFKVVLCQKKVYAL